MAERRMFAKSVVMSDAFLDMPMSARCLYFTLGMLADDDGFCGNPKSIMRQCGASQDDMKALIEKRYVLAFKSGVIVIKHWRMNNYLKNDRHHQTTYLEELSLLAIDDKGAYTEASTDLSPICIQDGDKVETECIQDGDIGKDRLGKDRLGKDNISEPVVRADYQTLMDMYNEICVSYPRLTVLSDARKKAIKARMKTYSIEDFKSLFQKAEASDFLKGKNDRNWSANFDWMVKDSNMAKVLDGNYDNKQLKLPEAKNRFTNIEKRDIDFEELEKRLLNMPV